MKYKILYDYGMEGNVIDDDEFDTVDDAVRGAVQKNYFTKFRIITIAWTPDTTTISSDKTNDHE